MPAAGRRGGFHIRPGFLRQREARRDEGIPPYVRPVGSGRSGLARNTKFIRRGGIYPARKTSRRRMAPGTMQASSHKTPPAPRADANIGPYRGYGGAGFPAL